MDSNDARSRTTLAEALDLAIDHHRSGRLAQAAALYEQILQLEPGHGETLYYLGRIEHQQGRFEGAEELLRRSLVANASQEDVHNSLGETLRAQGKFAAAVSAYREALRLNPGFALAQANLGIALAAANQPLAAEAAYREALRLKPESVETHNNLGVLLGAQGRWTEARDCFIAALRYKPDCVEAETNLGNVLCDEGQLPSALHAYRRALRINPDYGPAHFYLGIALRNIGQLADALTAFRRAVAIDPADAKARTNLGALCVRLCRLDEAVDECRKAIELDPGFALGHNNLASCLHARGQIEEAIPHFRRAVELNPNDAFLHSNLAHALNYAPGVDPREIFDEHVRWGRRHADVLSPVTARRATDRARERRLRIGYVSPYFREHAISVFTEPILAAHDHAQFEIICYSDLKTPDAATSRFRAHADRWSEIAAENDTAVAERIAADRVDILVDLTGHLDGNRLLAFARQPAPIQVSYIGYQNTTGIEAMDYRLTDDCSDPPGVTDRYYTEELIRLPRAFFCYQPSAEAPEVNALPALASGRVTFGSFNKLAKVTTEVLESWARILAGVSDSRLLILSDPSAEALRRVQSIFSQHGVSPERVEFVARRPRLDYLRLHHEVDIALDAFPFNGHTTVCEALWMGVPVVMKRGQTYVTRFGSSALAVLGLEELISTTSEQYVETAVRLAHDRSRLEQIRGQLRPLMLKSPLLDARGFTRNIEAAYRQMWRRFCGASTA